MTSVPSGLLATARHYWASTNNGSILREPLTLAFLTCMLLWFIIRALAGGLIGALPGVALAACGVRPQGDGIALIGWTIGAALAVSRPIYGTPTFRALERGITLFLRLTGAKMAPWLELLVKPQVEDHDAPPPVAPHQRGVLDRRMFWGVVIGVVLLGFPSIFACWNIPLSNDEQNHPPAMRALLRIAISIFATLIVGGGIGATGAAMTMRGTHRRDIILGTVCGALIGTGLAIAVEPGAKIAPRELYMTVAGGCAFIGMMCGFVSGVATYFGRAEEVG